MNDEGTVKLSLSETGLRSYEQMGGLMPTVWNIAAKKGVPVIGLIDSKPDPEYKYRVSFDHNEEVTIQWEKVKPLEIQPSAAQVREMWKVATEMLDKKPHVTVRIQQAVADFRKEGMTHPKVLRLGSREARQLYSWAMNNVVVRWSIDLQSAALKTSMEDLLSGSEFNGMRIEVVLDQDSLLEVIG